MPRRKDTRALKRRKPRFAPKKIVLIVCEGSKTEPNYFDHYRQSLRLSNVSVRLIGEECGTDPLSVVEFGLDSMDDDPSIDECHCVIDRDKHDAGNLAKANGKIHAQDRRDSERIFRLYISDPSIEYWFLLHFRYSRAPYESAGNKSRGDHAKDDLCKEWPEYKKNCEGTGGKLDDRFEKAADRADRALADVERTGEPNPSTNVHFLVRHLRALAT